MKPLNVWHGHSTRPSLPAGTARKGNGHLSGQRPLHLANARPFGRLKAPLGLSLLRSAALRKRELAYGRRNRLITPPAKRNRAFPTGNALLYISLSSVAFGRVRPGGAPCFFTMIHHFPRAASGILHQHESGSDAAHPGIVPIFCAGMPCKLARMQCHFPAYCPILSA